MRETPEMREGIERVREGGRESMRETERDRERKTERERRDKRPVGAVVTGRRRVRGSAGV